ncbi:MAG TPA: sugar phosphate isomerase/epimerase family protein [Chloroflexota bacterium]|nr:sugar phosphate isomerase/epimerase family protein [Chloroflexota bacterium]
MPKIYLNSFNYRKYSLERAMRRAREYGYDGVEIWSGHFKLETVEQTLQEAQRLGREIGIGAPVLNLSGNVIGDDPEKRQTRVRRLLEVIQRCPEYGVELINGYAGSLIVDRTNWASNGSAAATEEHYQRATDAYRTLGSAAERAGISITLEVHMNTIHDTAASTVRLLDAIGSPAIGANLDPGNMWGVRTSEHPVDAVSILGDRTTFVHFKNARRVTYLDVGVDYDFTLRAGELDYYAIVSSLVRAGFSGPYGIEWSGSGDPGVPSKDDVEYLRSLLRDVALDEALTSRQMHGAAPGNHSGGAPASDHKEPL